MLEYIDAWLQVFDLSEATGYSLWKLHGIDNVW